MPGEKYIVDCELSLLSDPFFYLPSLARFAEAHNKRYFHSGTRANIFYKEYHAGTLTLHSLLIFLKIYRHDLSQWINVHNKDSTPFHSLIRVKDLNFLNHIKELYKQSGIPIIIVTASPHTQLLSDCLNQILPQASFTVLYAPLLDNVKEEEIVHGTKEPKMTSSPVPGYNWIVNLSRTPQPDGKILRQRLLNTGYFCEEINGEKEQQELKQREKERQELEQKVTVTTPIQDTSLIPSTGANAAYERIICEAACEDIDGKDEVAQDKLLESSVGEKDEEDSTVIVLAHSNVDYKEEQDKPTNSAVYINGGPLSAFFSSGATHMRSHTPSGAKDMKPYPPPSPYATLSYATPPRVKVC